VSTWLSNVEGNVNFTGKALRSVRTTHGGEQPAFYVIIFLGFLCTAVVAALSDSRLTAPGMEAAEGLALVAPEYQ
jgi:hypothetical protein